MSKVVDLFCGVGGLTNGMIQSGLEVVAGIDIDESCMFAYEFNNFGAKFISKSVSEITSSEIDQLYDNSSIKILVGCAPCQPFSSHQKKQKDRTSHKDWGLIMEFLRIIKEVRPQIISMENVPNLVREDIFKEFVLELRSIGYNVDFRVVNTSKLGIPQNRRRLILLGSLLGNINFIPLPNIETSLYNVIGNLPEIEAGMTHQDDPLHVAAKLSPKNLERIRRSLPGGTWRDWPEELLPDCYKRESGQTYSSVYGRMRMDSIAPTMTTQFFKFGSGRFGHPYQDRAISLREGALIQSFPSEYVFTENVSKISFNIVGRQIGNAVPPRLGKYIGDCINEHIDQMGVQND